jgi:hypothetical protein
MVNDSWDRIFLRSSYKEHIYLDMTQNWFMQQMETLDMNDDA